MYRVCLSTLRATCGLRSGHLRFRVPALGVGPRESPGVGFQASAAYHARDGERGDGEGLARNDAPRIDGGFEDDVVHYFWNAPAGPWRWTPAARASMRTAGDGSDPCVRDRRSDAGRTSFSTLSSDARRGEGAGVVLEEGDADVRRVRCRIGHANLVGGFRKEVGEGVDPGRAVDGRRFRAEGRAGRSSTHDAPRPAHAPPAARASSRTRRRETRPMESTAPRRAHRARRARDPVWEGGTTRAACRPRQLSSSLTNNDET